MPAQPLFIMSEPTTEEVREMLRGDIPWEDPKGGESFFDDRGVPIDTPELRMWRGKVGVHYFLSNASLVGGRDKILYGLLSGIKISNILEIGCNVGNNLAVLCNGKRRLFGVEPMWGVLTISRFFNGVGATAFALPFASGIFDLVLLAGVLCHIRTEFLEYAVSEAVRVCRKNILVMDYYSKDEIDYPFRGTRSLWFRDFLTPFRNHTHMVSSGPLDGWDNKNLMHYGLFEKVGE